MSDETQEVSEAAEGQGEASELSAVLYALGVTDEWHVESIKEVAMRRFNVKKTRRPHIKQILDDAFEQLREYGR